MAQSANKSENTSPDLPVTVAFHELALMVSRLFNGEVRGIGLTRSQWQLLYGLYKLDGQTQTDLAESLSMSKPPLGKIIDRLEKDGWVARKADPKDRRANRVFLTDKVYPLIKPLERIVLEIGESAMIGFSANDRTTLHLLLERVHKNLTDTISNGSTDNVAE